MRRKTSDDRRELRFECRCSSGLRPAPSRSGKQKEGALMGRLGAYLARLGNPMQDCHLGKEPALRSMLWSHWRGGTRCWEISRLRFAALEMTVRHVPVRSLPADWYLRPLRTLTACSARILQRMRESANLSALGNPMQDFHSLKGQRELRRASRLSAD